MKQKHGKPKSACCDAKLKFKQNGEWPEFTCIACGASTDEDGKPYRYLPTDPTRSLGVSQTDA